MWSVYSLGPSATVRREPSPVRGETKKVKSSTVDSLGGFEAQPTHPVMCVILRGPWAGKTKNILPTCKFSLSELKPSALCSLQICAVYLAWTTRGTCCPFHALSPVLWARGGGVGRKADPAKAKRHWKPEAICFFHLHTCPSKGPHRARPEVLLLMGLRGPHKHSSSYENKLEAIRLLHSFAIKALVLRPLWNSTSFILAFPPWLGGINQTKKSL